MRKSTRLQNEEGYMLIAAVMLLFFATILGLMVGDSSHTEVVLSGAQQRYEDDFNTTEGGSMAEAAAVGKAVDITRNGNTRTYAVVNPSVQDTVISPTDSTADIFDPGDDMASAGSYTVTVDTDADKWPMDNLLQSDANDDDRYDYHYRVVYRHADVPPKGYDATKFSGYKFELGGKKTTLIEMGATKVGPKMNL